MFDRPSRPLSIHDDTCALFGIPVLRVKVSIRRFRRGGRKASGPMNLSMVCMQWAAITVVLVANPLLGGLAKTSLDRCLGSLIGAVVAMIGSYISTHGAFLVPFTAASIFSFHMAGQILDAGYSSKIAMLSYILVAGSCLRGREPYWRIALVRLAGIVIGVILAQLASVLIYSETHSDAAISRLQKSLRSTAELCEAAWLAWHLTDKPHVPIFLAAPAQVLQAALDQAAQAPPMSPAAKYLACPQPIPPWHGQPSASMAKNPSSPGTSGIAQDTVITGSPAADSLLLAPEASRQAQLRSGHGAGDGEAILGILQVEDRSVLPVTPKLLSQLADCSRHNPAKPVSSRRESCPAPAPSVPPQHETMYQTTSVPNLGCSSLRACPEDQSDQREADLGSQTKVHPPVHQHHGFGSLQDLVGLSQSTSVDDPASIGQVRAQTHMRALADAAPASASPLQRSSRSVDTFTAPGPGPVATVPQALSPEQAAPVEQHARSGPEAVSETIMHMPTRGHSTHSDAVSGDVLARLRMQQEAAGPDGIMLDSRPENAHNLSLPPTSAPLPPPKVASVAAWLDSMPTRAQLPHGTMHQGHLAQSGPGSAARGSPASDTQVAMPCAQDLGSADRQGTMYQAWRHLLGQHSDTSQANESLGAQPGLPSVHQLPSPSAFASLAATPANSASGAQAGMPRPCLEESSLHTGSQHGTQQGSQGLSSVGLSAQAASPHRTRITTDTAKSHRSLESVPASEIQWLLQAMGSALEPVELMAAATPNSTGAAVTTSARSATAGHGKKDSGRPGIHGANSHAGSQRQNGTCPISPCSAAAASAEPGGHQDPSARSEGAHTAADHVLGWDLEQQEASDRRCEDLLMAILQQVSKVYTDVEGTMGEVLVRIWKIQMFLPRPTSTVQKLRKNHMPRAAIQNLVCSIRITARILWALHMALREGFTRDMVVLLKDTYPAALLSDLRHFSIAALYDVVGAFPESFVATAPANVPQANLCKFISTVEALVTISRSHLVDTAEHMFSRRPLPVTPSQGLSMPSLPSLQASQLPAMASPAAGPVTESAINARGVIANGGESNDRGREQHVRSAPHPAYAGASRASNGNRGSAVNAAIARSAGASDCGSFGLEAEYAGGARKLSVRKRSSRMPFSAMFGEADGRSTLDGTPHRRASQVSQLSWETARQQDSCGPRWTRALMFPSTVEGFLARVRWQAFQQDVTQLAEQMMRLHQTVKNLLLHLPGPAGVADPTVVPDADL